MSALRSPLGQPADEVDGNDVNTVGRVVERCARCELVILNGEPEKQEVSALSRIAGRAGFRRVTGSAGA